MVKSFKLLFQVGILISSLVFVPVTNVYAISIPAEINKQFTPIFIDAGGVSVLRVSIFNPNTFQLTNASWSDNLVGVQPGLSIATPAGVVNTCGGAVVAVPGTTALSLSGGTVPAQVGATPGECYVEVNVTSTTPGNLINTIPANNLVSSGNDGGTPVSITNTTPASATLTVVAVTPPSVSKAFAPSNTMWVGETRTLTITIRNNDLNTPLTQVSITDTLPVGVTVSGTPTSPQCGGGIVTSTAGSVTLTGGTIAANTTCNIVLNVTSVTQGTYTNTIPAGPAGPGSIRTQQGVTNGAAATAPLNVQAIGVLKAFAPASIAAGGVSTVTLTLRNPTGAAYTGAIITDTMPAGLTIFGTPASPQCGGVITNTANSVTLTGGTIPASATPPLPLGTCTITFQVTTPANAPTATRTNTIPIGDLTTTQGVSNPALVSTNLAVQAGLTVLKAFAPASITAGGVSTVTVTLRNYTGAPFTGVNLTDTLPANVTVSGTPASPQCGGTITNTATAVTLAGGTIPAGTVAVPGTCAIVFQVTSSVAGAYTNTIPINNVVTDQGVGNLTQTNSNTFTVVNAGGPVTVAKAFQTSPILPGAPSRLIITITAPTDIGVAGITISDTLPANLTIVGTPTAPANPVTTCGGVLTAVIGTQTIALAGGAIAAASGTCTITVYVTSNTPGSYPNTIPAANVTTTEGRTNTAPSNTATLLVSSLSMTKAFFPPTVNANGLSRLTITLTNTALSALVSVSLTDSLTTMGGTAPGSGVFVAATPNASTTCTGGDLSATLAGSQTITMTGGSVPAQVGAVPGVCTISVDVQGRGGAAARTNTIPPINVTGTVQSTGIIINPVAQAQAVLNIAPLSIGVVKGFNPVLVYGGASSTMSVQLVNPNTAVLTGIAFTDDMNLLLPGMVIANPANLNVGTCGGVLTGNPGDTSFSFSGGVLLANTNCILTLSVSMNINGNRTNRIPAGAVTTFNGVSSPDPAEASLTNLPGASVSKVFAPNPILAGSTSTLTITIQNTSAIPLSGMGLSDVLPGTLPAGLEIANPSNLTNSCNGTVTAVPGAQTIQLAGGTLAGNLSCAISVSVTSTIPGSYLNTIPTGALSNLEGATNNLPATDTLVVTSPFFSLGNRVWFDTDNSATLNGTENGINGVTVQLYAADGSGNPTGAVLSTQATANGGYYRFDNLPAGDYVAVIPASQFGAGGVLDGYWSSSTTISGTGVVSEAAAPDPDNNTDNDDNGTLQTAGAFNGAVISSAVTLGPSNNEPTTDTDADPTNPAGEAVDNQSNRTVDFGFYRAELSNQIFADVNSNGTYDAGDIGIAGATVQLYASNGTTEINVGPDGILGTADDAAGGVTTGAGGTYLFSGLPQGDYVVKVTPPAGYSSTVDTANNGDTTNPNNNVNNNDNGVGTGIGQASSNVVTLTPGSFGAAVNNFVSNATGTTTNPTMDFGFIPVPFSLGNRVWFDTDNSGTINGTENGINGVTVQVYAADIAGNPTGAVLGTQTTANGGYYRFDNLIAGDYVVVIPATQFGAGGVLDGYWSSSTTVNGTGVVSETAAPDPDNNTDSDDNGTLQTAGAFNGAVISSAVTLGPTNIEPITDADADPTNPAGEAVNDQSNRTVDFGFYRAALSNQVFVDVNNNGTYDAGDTNLSGATVRLYASNGTTEINVGPDGILGTVDDAVGGVTTGAGGTYLFSGLPQGSYIVKVTPPVDHASTIDTADSGDSTNPDNNIDNNDNGIGVGTGQVSSNAVTLTPGNAGAATNNIVTNATGTTTNPTLDFGFISVSTFSLGNRVWFDTDNSGTINGTESGVNSVTVEIYAADGAGNPTGAALGTQVTASGGYYRFDNLLAGDYVVVIPSDQFGTGGVLDGYWSSNTTVNGTGVVSETVAPDADNDVDSDDNGTLQTAGAFNGAVMSRAVTLGPSNTEPITDADADPTNPAGESANDQSNRTVDFGFYRTALSNQIFFDANNNGTYDAGDTALPGAVVQLYASNGTTEINVGPDGILGTADDAAGGVTTGAGGAYLFSGLPQGSYIVKVTLPAGYSSTVDTADATDTATPNTNTDNNDNGVGTSAGQVASNPVTLIPGNAGVAANNIITNATGTTTNPTLDFGFVRPNGFAKNIIATNETFTSGNNVAIGEIVTYEIIIDLPAGTPFANVTVTDRMDKGLAFVDCLSVNLAGANVTGVVCPPAVTAITDPGDSAANPANPGRQVVFTIGNIPAPVTATTFVIQYRAIVLDVIENQQGVTLNNSVTWAWTGGSLTTSAPNVRIVEPDMDIDKSALPSNNVAVGTPILFTLTITHTAPSTTDAFDIEVSDVLPAGLEYIPCTLAYSGLLPTTSPVSCTPAANLIFTWDSFPLGQTATITFNARLTGTQPSVTNTASVAWSSLPLDPGPGGVPVQLSVHNPESTERLYDPGDPVNIYQVSASVTINPPAAASPANADLPDALPFTGFAPNVITTLPDQPKDKLYAATDVWMEIPSLGVNIPIVGVPLVDGDWNVSWLEKQAGWLNGTAFPGWEGNSALTAHVYLSNGQPGPFVGLGQLQWGDKIIVHAYGSAYTYEVRENRTVSPTNTSVLKHEEDSWLTLITCKTYNEATNKYSSRIAVRAALVSVQKDKLDEIPKNGK